MAKAKGKMEIKSNINAVNRALDRRVGQTLDALGRRWLQLAEEAIDAQPRFGPGNEGLMGAVDTGAMRDANRYVVEADKRRVLVGNPINYALYVTMGTWKMPKRPWLQESVLGHIGEYEQVVREHMAGG